MRLPTNTHLISDGSLGYRENAQLRTCPYHNPIESLVCAQILIDSIKLVLRRYSSRIISDVSLAYILPYNYANAGVGGVGGMVSFFRSLFHSV